MNAQWTSLAYFIAIVLTIIVLGAAFLVFWLILRGRIDLSQVLTEPDSTKASLSRFQFLLFTFVIAGLFLLLSVEAGAFVNIPNSVLGLLGISAGSYAVSKGIQASNTGSGAAQRSAAMHAAAAQEHAAAAQAAADKSKGV
ncbi:MAG TPA: hypothetical protein VG889_17860 [Rhizomicrobium sp.]|nr:hypothetical protein [Rhizomicrobium sp.]